MSCEKCKKSPVCSELCDKIKRILTKKGIKSANWIRPKINPKQVKKEKIFGVYFSRYKEIPFSSLGSTGEGDKDMKKET